MTSKMKTSKIAAATTQVSRKTFGDIKGELLASAFDITEELQVSLAQQVTVTVLESYWEETQHKHNGSVRFPVPNLATSIQLKAETSELLQELGFHLANLPVDLAAYEVGQLFTTFLPESIRARRGIFYTPPMLASRLISKAENSGVDWKKAHILDPACGGGAFLVQAALRIMSALDKANPEIVIRNLQTRLEGWEIDPFSSWLAGFFVEVAAVPISAKTGKLVNPNIRTFDSLLCDEVEFNRFDLVIGNPPFGRVRLDTELRKRYSRSLYGHANLYGIFTELAIRLTKPRGVIAYLTPASFLAGEYFKNLRSFLWEEAPPHSLDFVGSRKGVFDGVLQETVLATYRKSSRKAGAAVSAISLDANHLSIVSASMFRLPKSASDPWIIARNSESRSIVEEAQKFASRIEDWGYKVSTGPLVWNRFKDQLSARKVKNSIPIIWAESITRDGTFIYRSEKRNHLPYFKTLGRKDDWLRIRQECVLLQRTTAKEQKRRLIAAPMPQSFIDEYGCVTVENHLNMIYPVVSKPAVSIEVLSVFLNSGAADKLFRCLSGSVAVSAYEIESLPLPEKEKLTKLKRLVSRKSSKESIEAECLALYGQEE